MQKRILCFGDSNTHGYTPLGERYDESVRWPTAMARLLGEGCTVIEEGLNGRTCVFDDPVGGGYRSGLDYLPPCLMTHNPLDVVILMLGTNDTKARFNMSAAAIARAMMQLVHVVKQYAVKANGEPSRIIVASPAPILDCLIDRRDVEIFGAQAPEVSRGLAREYRKVSKLMRCDFFDAGTASEVSTVDGVHLTEEVHRRLAHAMAEKIRTIL